MLNLHVYDIRDVDAYTAVVCGQTFARDYPDRIGIRQGVVYRYGDLTLYAYRTKAGKIVVRGV